MQSARRTRCRGDARRRPALFSTSTEPFLDGMRETTRAHARPRGMPAIGQVSVFQLEETIMKITKALIPALAILAAGATAASAHITLESQQAPVASTYKAVFRVGHGCEGKPTVKVRVQIPEGVIAVKPQPKPGWTLEKVRGKYAKSYDYYGTPTSEGVKEIVWSGGSLPDDEYDEFVLRARLTGDLKPGTVLYFPVVQECPDGAAERWIEIPEAGKSADDYEFPAPGLNLLESK